MLVASLPAGVRPLLEHSSADMRRQGLELLRCLQDLQPHPVYECLFTAYGLSCWKNWTGPDEFHLSFRRLLKKVHQTAMEGRTSVSPKHGNILRRLNELAGGGVDYTDIFDKLRALEAESEPFFRNLPEACRYYQAAIWRPRLGRYSRHFRPQREALEDVLGLLGWEAQ